MEQALKYIKAFFVSFGCLIAAIFLYPFRNKYLDRAGRGPGIMLVHGWLHNDSAWRPFFRFFRKNGFGPINTVRYSSLNNNIEKAALVLKEKIAYVEMETKKPVNVLIGHSMGGLVSMEYALRYAPKDRITYVITMGTPFYGTYMAKAGLGPCAKEMCRGSSFLQDFHERLKTAKHIQVFNIASRADLMIRPWDTAVLKNQLFVEFVVFEDIGHMTYLFSEKVMKHITAYLSSLEKQFKN